MYIYVYIYMRPLFLLWAILVPHKIGYICLWICACMSAGRWTCTRACRCGLLAKLLLPKRFSKPQPHFVFHGIVDILRGVADSKLDANALATPISPRLRLS